MPHMPEIINQLILTKRTMPSYQKYTDTSPAKHHQFVLRTVSNSLEEIRSHMVKNNQRIEAIDRKSEAGGSIQIYLCMCNIQIRITRLCTISVRGWITNHVPIRAKSIIFKILHHNGPYLTTWWERLLFIGSCIIIPYCMNVPPTLPPPLL
jgi:hypothetical protein